MNSAAVSAVYPYRLTLGTRWKDNDVYGHVNNVEYYSYFDTVINTFLIRKGGLDIHAGSVIGLCVESHCEFKKAIAFPDAVELGLRAARLGHSSVRYEIGIFIEGQTEPAALGHFVHVFVDRVTRKSAELHTAIRAALETIKK